MTTLLLIRHGQIRANAKRRWHGATDSPLTGRGRRQADRLANHLGRRFPALGAIVSSPMRRCRDTASAVATAFGHPVQIDDDLREFNVGAFEDLTVEELHGRHDFFRQMTDDGDYAPPGGESVNGVAARMVPALQRLTLDEPGEIAVVSHGAALGIALAALLDENPRAWRNYHVENCSITELRLAPRLEVGAFNHTTHL